MKALLLSILSIYSTQSHCQLITHPGIGLQTMVGNDFLGSNYLVSNVTYTGSFDAIGEFDASNTNLSIDKGILLNTGSITDTIDGPFGPNKSGSRGINNLQPGDEFLSLSIGGLPTFNAAILEFDFVPFVDSINIPYVFGSEEYPEYSGSSFNDFFGFFLSGPGIPGELNISTLPSGQVVSINSVNNGNSNSGPCTNCEFYTNNGDGSNAPFNTDSIYIQYDGLIEGLSARAENLQVGETYHLKIAVADVGDEIYDSGLFIGSCSTCNYAVNVNEFASEEIQTFPNPASVGQLLNITGINNFSYMITDLSGKVVTEGNALNNIPTNNLISGNYILELKSMHKSFIVKLILL